MNIEECGKERWGNAGQIMEGSISHKEEFEKELGSGLLLRTWDRLWSRGTFIFQFFLFFPYCFLLLSSRGLETRFSLYALPLRSQSINVNLNFHLQ